MGDCLHEITRNSFEIRFTISLKSVFFMLDFLKVSKISQFNYHNVKYKKRKIINFMTFGIYVENLQLIMN